MRARGDDQHSRYSELTEELWDIEHAICVAAASPEAEVRCAAADTVGTIRVRQVFPSYELLYCDPYQARQ